ncbi:MAG: hypothetical protein PHF67_00440 [Candidatus Nanoarchaeia archaeon]|nr:hypothetical protein [Candidatus Nanoarchaeia archaeon]
MNNEYLDYREPPDEIIPESDRFYPEDFDLQRVFEERDYFERNLELGYLGDCNQLEQLADKSIDD